MSAIINLAAQLGHAVVAEGVETVAQLSFLRERKCSMIQGPARQAGAAGRFHRSTRPVAEDSGGAGIADRLSGLAKVKPGTCSVIEDVPPD